LIAPGIKPALAVEANPNTADDTTAASHTLRFMGVISVTPQVQIDRSQAK
jgi:hypothetical protein